MRHSAIIINPLIVTAFAAFAMIGHRRWFLAWLGCHAAIYGGVVIAFETNLAGHLYGIVSYASGAAIMLFLHWALDRAHRASFVFREALEEERARTEELLYNVLPPKVAQRLKDGEIVADSFSDASVIFIDVIGFSALAKSISPGHLVDLLERLLLARRPLRGALRGGKGEDDRRRLSRDQRRQRARPQQRRGGARLRQCGDRRASGGEGGMRDRSAGSGSESTAARWSEA